MDQSPGLPELIEGEGGRSASMGTLPSTELINPTTAPPEALAVMSQYDSAVLIDHHTPTTLMHQGRLATSGAGLAHNDTTSIAGSPSAAAAAMVESLAGSHHPPARRRGRKAKGGITPPTGGSRARKAAMSSFDASAAAVGGYGKEFQYHLYHPTLGDSPLIMTGPLDPTPKAALALGGSRGGGNGGGKMARNQSIPMMPMMTTPETTFIMEDYSAYHQQRQHHHGQHQNYAGNKRA